MEKPLNFVERFEKKYNGKHPNFERLQLLNVKSEHLSLKTRMKENAMRFSKHPRYQVLGHLSTEQIAFEVE